MNSSVGATRMCQARKSGSSMFQSDLGRTSVPTFCRETINPLASRARKASRKVGRETPKRTSRRASVGSRDPGA